TPANQFVATNVCPNHCDVTAPDGSCRQWGYDAPTKTKRAPAFGVILSDVRGVPHLTYYDGDWQLFRDTNFKTGETTDYSYDSNLNLVGIANPSGDRICFEHDAAGRVVQSTRLPVTGATGGAAPQVVLYTYDAKGQLTDVVEDPQGRAAHLHFERDPQE